MSKRQKQKSTPKPSVMEPVPSKIPVFDLTSPHVWFKYLEAYFHFRSITSQTTMFWHAFSELPPHIAREVYDVVEPMPQEDAYNVLKTAVLKRVTPSDDARLHQLLCEAELGDRTPSQLLRHMRSLVDKNHIDDCILRKLWSKRLPSDMTAILAAQPENTPLEILAEVADKIHDTLFKRRINCISQESPSEVSFDRISALEKQIAQITLSVNSIAEHVGTRSANRQQTNSKRTRSPSTSKSPQICYYHQKFGDKARKCTLPCAHPNAFYHKSPGDLGNFQARQ